MSVSYRSIYPVSQQETYLENNNIDFVLNLANEKLIPGTVTLEGLCGVYADLSNATRVTGHEEILYDPLVGYHGLIRDVTTEFQGMGIMENLQNYPRLVKVTRLCSDFEDSYGSETRNSVEGCLPNHEITCGMVEGVGGKRQAEIPFSLALQNVCNKMSGPVSSAVTGQIRIRLRLAPADEFLWGKDYVSGTTGYNVKQLKLRYQTMPDDGKRQPVNMEMYHSYRVNLDTNNQNVSTFVPGLCNSVHMSFIKLSDENAGTANYLSCQPPPGQPPLGYSDIGVTPAGYGIERLYYAINDTDSALVGWTVESREEIMRNGIRSVNPNVDRYSTLARKLRDSHYPDGYIAGIPFGGLLDFSKNKFAAEIQSQCDTGANEYVGYMHFRMASTVNA